MRITNKTKIFVTVLLSVFVSVLLSKTAYAYTTIEQKALGYAINQCYNSGLMKSSVQLKNVYKYDNLLDSSNSTDVAILPKALLTSVDFGTATSVKCKKLVNTLVAKAGINTGALATDSDKKNLLEKMGYAAQDNSTSSGRCLSFNLQYMDPNKSKITDNPVSIRQSSQLCSNDGTANKSALSTSLGSGNSFQLNEDRLVMVMTGGEVKYYNYGNSFDSLKQQIESDMRAYYTNGVDQASTKPGEKATTISLPLGSDAVNYGSADESRSMEYKLKAKGAAQITATNNLLGSNYNSISQMIFTADDKYQLYYNYLKNTYGINGIDSLGRDGTVCKTSASMQEMTNAGYKQILMSVDGNARICYAKATRNESLTVGGVNSSGYYTGEQKSWTEIIDELFSLRNQISASVLAAPETSGSTSGGNQGATENTGSTCKTAAKSMGWLLCTILDGVGNGVQELYTKFVEPNLSLEPELFGLDETDGTKMAWNTFRDIANVAIVVLFLVVIFSQLTGVGIDNYGIKKILPKLILVAILMNLSYYICIALVDVSNIAGSGVQDIFNNLEPSAASLQSKGYDLGSGLKDVVSATLLGTAVAGTAWGFSLATLLALIPTAISVLVSIFFLFILLAAREAAVVVLVVLAPLAFACFILPNTKKIFDRWVKVGEALLLVYPIAGLLVAGGNYVSRVLLNAGGESNIASAITAMLVGIVPIFFIPSVLRSSMSGLGNIGNKISNLGSRLGRGAGSAVGNSELFKMQQQRANEARARKLAGLKKDKDGNWTDSARGKFAKSGFGRALGLKRMQDRYRGQANSMETARRTEEQMGELGVLNAQRTKDDNILKDRAAEAQVGVPVLTEDLAVQRAEARRNAQELKAFQDQLANFSNGQLLETAGLAGNNPKNNPFGANGWLRQAGGAQKMAALMGAMINNGMENDIYKLLENDVDGEIGNNSSVMQMLAGVKEKGLKAYGKKGKGRSYVSFMEDEVDVLDDDGNPTGRRATLIQQYIDDKGNEFYSDLSDKTMKQILRHGGMTNGQVIDVVSKAKSQDLINVGDQILQQRMAAAAESGEQIKITGNQLASLSPTTISTLNSTEVGRQAILEASQDLIRNNRLQTGIDSDSRTIIDNIRESAGQDAIWTVAEKRAQNAPTVEATELDVSAERVQQAQQAVLSGSPEITVNAGGGVSGFEAAYNARTASTQQPVVQQQVTVEPVVQQTAQPVVQAAAEQAVVDTSSAGPMPTASADFGPVPVQYQSTGINELFNDATRKSGADLDGVNSAIMNYQGSDFKVTGDQLVGLKLSTVTALTTSDNPTHRQAMLTASDEVANNPALKARLGGPVLARINAFRVSNGRPTL